MNNSYVLSYDIFTALGKTLLDKMENSSSRDEAEILLNCLGEANKSVQEVSSSDEYPVLRRPQQSRRRIGRFTDLEG